MIKIKIKVASALTDANAVEIEDSLLAKAKSESMWQPGVATLVSGSTLNVERRWNLDEFEYRYKEHILSKKDIVTFVSNEWMDWRDGK